MIIKEKFKMFVHMKKQWITLVSYCTLQPSLRKQVENLAFICVAPLEVKHKDIQSFLKIK